MKKILTIFTFFTAFIAVTMSMVLLPVLADDTVDGTFNSTGFNNPTEYTKFTLQEVNNDGDLVGSTLNSGTALTPQQTYRFTLGVSDEDTLEDVVSIQVHFYYQTFDEEALTNDEGTYFVAEWVSGSGVFVVSDGGVFTTWEIERSTIPDLTQKSGEFSFDLTLSKVARISADTDWKVGLVVVDGAVAEGYDPKAVTHAAIRVTDNGDPLDISDGASSFNMNWYGEIELTERVALWTEVFPNLDFGEEGSQVTISGVNYIANGAYNREIKTDDVWNISGPAAADGSTQAALTTDLDLVGSSAQPDSAQQFALRVADSDEPSLPTENNGLIPVGETATLAFATDKGFTFEAGVDVDVYLWLALSTRFQNATYTGDIVLSIVNTVE